MSESLEMEYDCDTALPLPRKEAATISAVLVPAGDVEEALPSLPPEQSPPSNIVEVTELSVYNGESLGDKIDDFLTAHPVAIISKSTCPFCRDIKDFLARQIGVTIHVIDVDLNSDGTKILAHTKRKTGHKSVPMVFIHGEFYGGCDDIKAMHTKGELEPKLKSLSNRPRTTGTDKLETSQLLAPERGSACHPLFWFPNAVNNYVIRVVGFQVCALSVVSAVFLNEAWGR